MDVEAFPGSSLAQGIWLSGRMPPLPLCGGLGHCGRCRVRFVRNAPLPTPEEYAFFPADTLSAGWRLACRHALPVDSAVLELEIPQDSLAPDRPSDMTRESSPSGVSSSPSSAELVLAVDLGTTSICWRALRSDTGATVAQGHSLNPQAAAGSDVMSRLAVARAPAGRHRLSELVRAALKDVLVALEAQGYGRVIRVCLAANTTMTDIFFDRDVEGLCAAPYQISHTGDETCLLPDFPPVYVPPLPAPFVGGDVSAGLAALLATEPPRPFVLADLGTNGELALLTKNNQLWLTSVPLGPALEGIGPECGHLAEPDVITAFHLGPQGISATFHPATRLFPASNSTPRVRGISATGYLSLLAALRRVGLLDSEGHFVPDPAMPLARRLAASFRREHADVGPCLYLPHGLWLTAADVEALLKVKAAFATALDGILKASGCVPASLAVLCLAGALGEHVVVDDLVTLGFMPPSLATRIRLVGNTSLDGASLLALHGEVRQGIAHLCAHAHVLSLADIPDFSNIYLRHMHFGV